MNKKHDEIAPIEELDAIFPKLVIRAYSYLVNLRQPKECVIDIAREVVHGLLFDVYIEQKKFDSSKDGEKALYKLVKQRCGELLELENIVLGEPSELGEQDRQVILASYSSSDWEKIDSSDLIGRAFNTLENDQLAALMQASLNYGSRV